jgi:hypothetical protein
MFIAPDYSGCHGFWRYLMFGLTSVFVSKSGNSTNIFLNGLPIISPYG